MQENRGEIEKKWNKKVKQIEKRENRKMRKNKER